MVHLNTTNSRAKLHGVSITIYSIFNLTIRKFSLCCYNLAWESLLLMESHSKWTVKIHPVTLLAYWGRYICIMFVICLEEWSDMLGREQGRSFCWFGDSITTRKLLPGMTLETDWKEIQLYFPEDFCFGTHSGFIFTPQLNIISPGKERNIWMPME